MMRPTQKVITASGLSTPIPIDYYANGYAISVTMKTAGAAYTLQYSLDDPNFDPVASQAAGQNVRWSNSYNVSGVWFNWDDPTLVNASANKVTNLAFAARAVRVNVTAAVSAGNPMILTIVANGMDAE